MSLYVLSPDTDQYQTFIPVDEDYDETHGDLYCKGEKLAQNWPCPLDIELDDDDGEKDIADFSYLFAGSLVLNAEAKSVLDSYLSIDDELMPLDYEGRSYWLLNIRTIKDALNQHATEYNEVGLLTKKVFDSKLLGAEKVFKINEDNKTFIFCTHEVVNAIRSSGLTGLIFEEVPVI